MKLVLLGVTIKADYKPGSSVRLPAQQLIALPSVEPAESSTERLVWPLGSFI